MPSHAMHKAYMYEYACRRAARQCTAQSSNRRSSTIGRSMRSPLSTRCAYVLCGGSVREIQLVCAVSWLVPCGVPCSYLVAVLHGQRLRPGLVTARPRDPAVPAIAPVPGGPVEPRAPGRGPRRGRPVGGFSVRRRHSATARLRVGSPQCVNVTQAVPALSRGHARLP
jgi:hypothetical protein